MDFYQEHRWGSFLYELPGEYRLGSLMDLGLRKKRIQPRNLSLSSLRVRVIEAGQDFIPLLLEGRSLPRELLSTFEKDLTYLVRFVKIKKLRSGKQILSILCRIQIIWGNSFTFPSRNKNHIF